MARHSQSEATRRKPIITTQAQNIELYGLDVQIDFNFLGCALTSDNAGIINNGNVREDAEVLV